MCPQRRRAVGAGPGSSSRGQREHGAAGGRPDRVLPRRRRLGEQSCSPKYSPSASVPSTASSPYLPAPTFVDLAVRDQEDPVGRLAAPRRSPRRPGTPLDEPAGQSREHVDVVEAPQQRQLAELGGITRTCGAGVGERRPGRRRRCSESPVHPVGGAVDLHPRQRAQQPPRRDGLHLRGGLGRRGQLPGGRCARLNWVASRSCWGPAGPPSHRRRRPRRIRHDRRRVSLGVYAAGTPLVSCAELDVLEDAERVGHHHGGRVVGADQVGDDRLLVDVHEAHRQARLVLVGQAGLVQADDALVVLVAGAHQDDRAGALLGDRDLVARQDRDAAPGRHLVPPKSMLRRVDAGPVALLAERRDRPRVGQEDRRLLPHRGQQVVHVVRGRRAGAGVDALAEVGVVQQAEVAAVDQLVLLALAQRLDGQPQLLLGLVHRLVVEVGDAAVHAQHGLRDAELVLARRGS